MDMGMRLGMSGRGGGAAAESLGPELIVNGDMSSETGWTLAGDNPPVIAAGKMTFTGTGDQGNAIQAPSLEAATYRLVYTIDSISGTGAIVQTIVGGGNGTDRTTAGTFSEDILGDGSDAFQLNFGMDEADGSIVIDNVSLKQIL